MHTREVVVLLFIFKLKCVQRYEVHMHVLIVTQMGKSDRHIASTV